MSKPFILVIPGAWHCTEHYNSIVEAIKSHGYNCMAIDLPSTQPPGTPARTLAEDITAIRSAVNKELDNGNNIVIVAHSFGGHAANRALKDLDSKSRTDNGFSTSVLAIAFIAALPCPPGGSLIEAFGGKPGQIHDVRPDNLVWVGAPGPEHWFYNDLPEDEAKKWSAMLQPHSWVALCERAPDAAYLDIPCGYLFCKQDNALPMRVQQMMVDMGKAAGARIDYTETLDSGHSPFLSMPKKTLEYIRRMAGESIERST